MLHVHAGIGWEGQALARAGAARRASGSSAPSICPGSSPIPGRRRPTPRAAASVDAFVCVSDAAAATWERALGAAAAAALGSRRFRNGVVPPSRSDAAERHPRGPWHRPDGARSCSASPGSRRRRTTRSLIEACALLRAEGRTVRLVLVGDGPERAAREAQVASAALEGVLFLGMRDDVGDLLAAADLLVLPSLFEGLPLVVLEAMAVGLPVVATRIGGTVEALGAEHPFLCEAGDPDDLARALIGGARRPRLSPGVCGGAAASLRQPVSPPSA